MPLQIGLKVKAIADGLWTAELTQEDVRHLGKPVATIGDKIVLGVVEPRILGDTIFCSPGEITVLNGGTSLEALVVELTSRLRPSRSVPAAQESEDGKFFSQCRELLPTDVANLAQSLISAVRKEHPGHMHEGQGRKWVNYPSNFLAITVQNKLRCLAVSVKGTPDKHPGTPFNLKNGMRGYSEFKISKSSDLEPALRIIKRSAAF